MSGQSHGDGGRTAEMRRQQALWAALTADLRAPGEPPACPPGAVPWRGPQGAADAADGLRAGRAHAQASAWRAVTARYPVLAEWLGDEAMQALARDLWRGHPPRLGDLARFGDEAPELIAAQPELAAWPWLAELARLESAVHAARTAPDTPPAVYARGLGPLAGADPHAWCLQLAPGSAWVAAPAQAIAVWQAHAGPGRAPGAAPDRARLTQEGGAHAAAPEGAWVWRHAWQVQVTPLGGAWAAWHQALLSGQPLGPALAAQWRHHPGFDFSAWWHQAMTRGWVVGCSPAPAAQETP